MAALIRKMRPRRVGAMGLLGCVPSELIIGRYYT
jgi:hypothetical protein